MVGAKSAEETMAYMAACDIFCLPSWSEGFGIVYLEAMAHGKPVIAVQGQGITSIVTKNETGILIPPHDSQAVANTIKSLIDNPQDSRQMGSRGKNLILKEFSLERWSDKMIGLYEQILHNG